jgi:hypothetical protein
MLPSLPPLTSFTGQKPETRTSDEVFRTTRVDLTDAQVSPEYVRQAVESYSVPALAALRKARGAALPVMATAPQPPRTSSLRPSQEWEGKVVRVEDDAFVALLYDKTNRENPTEEVRLDASDISDDQWSTVRPGAIFYWTIGREKSPAGQIRNISEIVFQRSPRWTVKMIQSSKERARSLARVFSDDE